MERPAELAVSGRQSNRGGRLADCNAAPVALAYHEGISVPDQPSVRSIRNVFPPERRIAEAESYSRIGQRGDRRTAENRRLPKAILRRRTARNKPFLSKPNSRIDAAKDRGLCAEALRKLLQNDLNPLTRDPSWIDLQTTLNSVLNSQQLKDKPLILLGLEHYVHKNSIFDPPVQGNGNSIVLNP